jgi:hypothetical protein
MPKLPKRLPYELAIAAAMTVGSCSNGGSFHSFTRDDYERLERADVNARNAMARQSEIIDRLDRIEQRLDMQ